MTAWPWTRVLLALVAAASIAAGATVLSGIPWADSPPTGPAVQEEVPVTATDQLRQPSNNSPVIIADPSDDRLLFLANRLDAPDFGCALHRSGDGGRHWVPADPVPALPAGAEKCYAPEIAFDAGGSLHFLFVGLHGEGNEPMGAFITTSSDGGRTFTPPRQVLGPLEFGVRMAIDREIGDRGRMHLVWLHVNADPPLGGFPSGPNPILTAYSDDGGATFSSPVQVSDPARARVVAPALTLGDEGAVYVTYYDLMEDSRDYQGLEGPVWEDNWSIVMATSLDGGLRYGPGVVVDDEIIPPERPILIFTMAPPTVAAGASRVCTAWTDARHGDPDVLARCASRRAEQWEPVRRINDDPIGNGVDQYLPRISMAPGGRLDAVFLDRRRHVDNDRNDVSYAYSDDDGRSFAPSMLINTKPWSPLIGQRYVGPAARGKVEIGGRLALLSQRSGAVAAWPDTRWPGPPQPGLTEQDVYAATIAFGDSDGRPGWALGAGTALVVAGLMAAVALAVRRGGTGQGRPSAQVPETDEILPVPSPEQPAVDASPPSRWVPALIAGAAVVAAAVVAWALLRPGEAERPAMASDVMPQVVDVITTEYRFEYTPPAAGGRTIFRVHNTGTERHGFEMVPLPEDFPPIDEQIRGAERRSVEPFVDLGAARPGETDVFAVDLLPNQRYALICLVRTETRETHASLGHNSEFRTG